MSNLFFEQQQIKSLPVRSPATLGTRYVCPTCKRELSSHMFDCEGHIISVPGVCIECGEVVPVKSAVWRED